MAQKLSLTWIFFSITILNIFTLVLNQETSPFTFLATDCERFPQFAKGSEYEANLKALFHDLSSNATARNGYHQAISGDNTLYGHFLCRGDQNTTACKDCINNAINKKLPKTCPNRVFAVIWYDECMIKYSFNPFFGVLDLEWVVNYQSSQGISADDTPFHEHRSNMMIDRIAERASKGGSKKFATDYQNFTDSNISVRNVSLYGLEQCTPDLSEDDCKTCLLDAIKKFMNFDGGRVFHYSCIARYEVKPFFNLSTVRPWPAPPPSLTTLPTGTKMSVKVIVAIVITITIVLMALLALGIRRVKHKKLKTDDAVAEVGEDFTDVESLQYDFATLQTATLNFSDEKKLGEGGFGIVYKGTLSNGNQVAVKRLSKTSTQGVQQFKNEVSLVAKLQHRNLVRLLGFCLEGQEKLLVYEYVPNKSLDYFLFDANAQGLLCWGIRYNLIVGIARGMLYMHRDSQLRIIHRDLKANNVLLDADMRPKISDFGTARIFGEDQSQSSTSRVVGTLGYMSPEYAMHGQFSIKSDVYSFGVLVLEIISGKRNTTFYQSGKDEDLLSYAWRKWRDSMLLEFVDPAIRDSCLSDEVVRCIHFGLLCVQEYPDDRPTMETIVLTLDSYSSTLPAPTAPGFFIKSGMESNISKEAGSYQPSSKSTHSSVNDISITEPEPR